MKKIILVIFCLLALGLSYGQQYTLSGSDSVLTKKGLYGYYAYTYIYITAEQTDTLYFQSITPGGEWIDLTIVNMSLNEIVLAGRPLVIPSGKTYCVASYELFLYGIRIIRKTSIVQNPLHLEFKFAGR